MQTIRLKKLPIYIFVISLIFPSILLGQGIFKKPSFSFERVEIQDITLSEVILKLHTTVTNPYPISIPNTDITIGMQIEGKNFTTLKGNPGSLTANSTQPLPFSVKVKYDDLLSIYKAIKGKSKEIILVKLKGNLDIPIPAQVKKYFPFVPIPPKVSFPFEAEREIPSVLPSISIVNFKIIKPSLNDIKVSNATTPAAVVKKAAGFLNNLLDSKKGNITSAVKAGLEEIEVNVNTEFDIVLKNESNAVLQFENMKYELFLGKEKFLSGDSEAIKNSGKESVITVKTTFPLKSLSQSVANAVKLRSTDFRLTGSSGIKIPALPNEGVMSFKYDKSGKFSW